jgi:alpha-ketoglutarate-dependent taurine dioxygenase
MVRVRIEGPYEVVRNAVEAGRVHCSEPWLTDAKYLSNPTQNSPLALDPEAVKAFGGTVSNGVITAENTQTLRELARALRANNTRRVKFSMEEMVEHTRKRAREDMGKPYSPQIDHFIWLSRFVLPSGQYLEVERRLIEPTLIALKEAYPGFAYEML